MVKNTIRNNCNFNKYYYLLLNENNIRIPTIINNNFNNNFNPFLTNILLDNNFKQFISKLFNGNQCKIEQHLEFKSQIKESQLFYPSLSYEQFLMVLKYKELLIISKDYLINKNLEFIEDFFDENGQHNDIYSREFWNLIEQFKKLSGNLENINSLINYTKDLFISINLNGDKKFNNMKLEIDYSTNLEDYLQLRFLESTNLLSFKIPIALNSNTLQKEIYKSNEYQMLQDKFVTILILVNDFNNFIDDQKKQIEIKNNSSINFIKIYAVQCGSIQISLNYVKDKIIEELDLMAHLINNLNCFYPNNSVLKVYLQHLQNIIFGSLKLLSIK